MSEPQPKPEPHEQLKRLPRDELFAYCEAIGLEPSGDIDPDELERAVEARRRLIESIPRERLLEVVVWARQPVRKSADRFELAREIVQVRRVRFAGLSTDGLRVLALLHNCELEPDDDRRAIAKKLKRQEGFWRKFRRKRRALFGKLIAGMVGDDAADYRFLPEEQRPLSLKERIEEEGVVGGLTGKIRGAADGYVREKLDEIEARIDRKLAEIDDRLAEWRDREIMNRMRIIKITLFASIIVALLSLGYTWIKARFF